MSTTQQLDGVPSATAGDICRPGAVLVSSAKPLAAASVLASASFPRPRTLPTDSKERANTPLVTGVLNYFPAAIVGVARASNKGNVKHTPGVSLRWDRSKGDSNHDNAVMRHMLDLQGLLADAERGYVDVGAILEEVDALAWRALALSQTLHEKYANAPTPPGVK